MNPILLGILLAAIAIGLLAGLGRDFLSRERAVLDGAVVETTTGGTAYRSPTGSLNSLDVRLSDGRMITITTGLPVRLTPGTPIRIAECITPWGQVWYAIAK